MCIISSLLERTGYSTEVLKSSLQRHTHKAYLHGIFDPVLLAHDDLEDGVRP